LPVVRWQVPVVNLLFLCFCLNHEFFMEKSGLLNMCHEGASMITAKKMPTFWRAKQQCELSVINTYWIPFLLAGGGYPWLIYCLCAFGSTLKFSWKIRVALCEPGR
ncbi:hypothetical protein, partial [Escherichia coli]|uniref:hypothetical protein n=6 Tax=Escherichia coli TaxID=562 RepID=UPI00050B5B51